MSSVELKGETCAIEKRTPAHIESEGPNPSNIIEASNVYGPFSRPDNPEFSQPDNPEFSQPDNPEFSRPDNPEFSQ